MKKERKEQRNFEKNDWINKNYYEVPGEQMCLDKDILCKGNKVYSRENLLNLVWGYEYPGDARTVDVHVRRLREKIEENPSEPKYVHTRWGVGYYYNA